MSGPWEQYQKGPWTRYSQIEQPTPRKPPEEDVGFLRRAADVPVLVGQGFASGFRMVADAFGANNPVSQSIRGIEDYLGELTSAEAQGNQQRMAEVLKEAEDKGILDQLKIGLKAVSEAPVELLSQGLGTIGATALSAAAAKIIGTSAAVARGAGAVQALQAGARAQKIAGPLTGAAMGLGVGKGSIYEAVKEELMSVPGMTEERAESTAQEAQSYGGGNLDQILLAGALGGASAAVGADPRLATAISNRVLRRVGEKAAKEAGEQAAAKTPGLIASGVRGGAAEFATEFPQGAQEKLAANIALQREGFDVPTLGGVIAGGVVEGVAGAGIGAGVGAATAPRRPAVAPEAKEDLPPSTPEGLEAPPAEGDLETPTPRDEVATLPPGAISGVYTEADIAGIPGAMESLSVRRNILGRTRSDLEAIVSENPEILQNDSAYARTVRSLIAEPARQPDQLGMEPSAPVAGRTDVPDTGAIGAPERAGVDIAGPIAGPAAIPARAPAPAVTDTSTGLDIAGPVAGPVDVSAPAPAPSIAAPAGFRYSLIESPAYEGVPPLSIADADFELEALQDRLDRGRQITPEIFAQSEIGKRLDTSQVMAINEGLRADPAATIRALRASLIPAPTPTVTETPIGITTPQAIEAETQRPQAPRIPVPPKQVDRFGEVRPGPLDEDQAPPRLSDEEIAELGLPTEARQPKAPKEPKAPTIKPIENPANIGADAVSTWKPGQIPSTVPVATGGVPFRNRGEAEAARRLQPAMRLLKVPNGFLLTPKTDAQMEAQARAGRKLGIARTGERGAPRSAMEFIAEKGGLDPRFKSETIYSDSNPRVGNRFLFAGQGKGLTLGQVSEALQQEGYIDVDDINLALEAINNPTYTAEGNTRLAEMERDRLEQEYKKSELLDEATAEWVEELGYDVSDLVDAGFLETTDKVKAEVGEMLRRAEGLGIHEDDVFQKAIDDAYTNAQLQGRNRPTQYEIYTTARKELESVLERGPEDRIEDTGQPSAARDELTLAPPTREAQAEAERRAAEAEKAEQEAAKEADKAKAEEARERERKEIVARSAGAAEDFQLGQTAEQNLTGQKDILFSTDAQISTNQEKQEVLARFKANLELKAPKFRTRGGSGVGRIITISPRQLTKAQVKEIVDLASEAIDLGMPASILNGIGAAGSANVDSKAAITQPDGHLLIGKPWATMTFQKKLQTFIHEIGHQADFQNTEEPSFSANPEWAKAYKELENWYESDIKERKKAGATAAPTSHPMAYPFAPQFKGAVRLRQEAFAQAFAYYFTDPTSLQSNAPISFGQIQTILEGIQNESQPTSRTSEAARKAAEGKVQPAGTEGVAGVRSRDSEIVSKGGQAADGGQRGGAPVKGEKKSKAEKEAEQEAIDKQEANVPSIWGGTIRPSFVVDNEINWFERYIMQPIVNRNYDARNVYNSIRKANIDVPKRFDINELETTSSAIEGESERQFVDEEVAPILKEMAEKNISSEDVHNYMLALHAEERNREVARRNSKYPDGGSGMKNQEALDYLSSINPDRRKNLQSIKDKLDAIQQGTRELIVETGQEKASTVKSWTDKFKNYVPLFREEMEYDDNITPGQGTGVSVRGDFSRSFTGSSKPVQDVFASIVAQRQRAIARGMKMRQGRGLFGLALTAPNPNLWMAVDPRSTKMEQLKRYQNELAEIRGELAGGVADPIRQEKLEDRVGVLENRIERLKPQAETDLRNLIDGLVDFGLSAEEISNLMAQPFEAVYSPTSGMVEYKPNKLLKSPYVVATRINGEEVYVFFNKNSERARRMAEQLHGMGTEPMDIFNRILAPITRWFAAINTQYNPIWGTYNFLRDSQGAAIQANGTIIEDSKFKVVHDGFKMLRPIFKVMRAERDGKIINTEVGKAFRELREEGGTTGFKDNFSRQEDRLKALADRMKQITEGKAKSILRNDVFGLVSDFNVALENTIRLAAYMEAKRKYTEQYMKEGLSQEAAELRAKQPSAVVAKNITVNFNQKGGLNAKIGSMFAFFNAAIQGTVRAAGTLFTWDKPGDFNSLKMTPFGRKFIGGALAWGVMQPLILLMAGIDPDDLEEYQKERNFIIPLGDGKMFFFPMPFVFSAIPNTSRIMTEWFVGDMKDTGKYVGNLAGAYLNAFNPFGGSLAVQTFTPTPFKPIIALAQNEDAFGRKIARESFNEKQQIPGYQMAKDSASAFGKVISELINYTTGGTKDVAGAFSPTPDQVDYFVGQLTGGLGREVLKASQVAQSPFTGEKVPFYKYPLVGRFGADVNEGGAIAGKFYNNLTKLNAYENTVKGMRQRKEPLGDYLNENPQARLYNQANIIERDLQKLRKTIREAKERGDKERVGRLQEQIKIRMQKFNERVAAAEK